MVLESYAAGKPVIGTRIPGLEDFVWPGETGWLVPPDSSEALAAALADLMSDRDRCRQMGRNVCWAVAAYSWPSIAAEHLHLYDQVCRGTFARQAA